MSKRAAGEGSVFRRKNGVWVALTPYPERKSFSSKTRATALARRDAYLKHRGVIPSSMLGEGKRTTEEFLLRWVAVMGHSLKPRTHDWYSSLMRLHAIPLIGKVPMWKLGPAHIQVLIDTLTETKGANIAKKVRRALLQAFNYAVQWRIIPYNPAAATWPPRVEQGRGQPYNADELQVWLKFLRGRPEEALVLLLTLVGLRRGEVLAMTWKNTDLDRGTARIENTLQRYGGELHFDSVKTSQSNRTIPLPDVVVEALRSHKERQVEQRQSADQLWEEQDLVFTTRIGTPIEPRNLTRRIQNLMRQAEIPVRRVHDLRHTAATMLLKEGVQVKTVQTLLGHASAQITLDTYAHVVPGMMEIATGVMDKLATRD